MSYTQPKLIIAGGLSQHKVVYVASGGYHNAAISDSGGLFTWGRADVGQLGLPEGYLQTDEMGKVSTFPKQIPEYIFYSKQIKQVALGEAHTIVLNSDAHVFTFGWNDFGQLGVQTDEVFNVHRLGAIGPCCLIAAGAISSFAVDRSRTKLYAWGSQQNGQLGVSLDTKNTIFSKPTPVVIKEMGRIKEIVCADSSTIVRSMDTDRVFGWGRGFSIERQLDISRFKPKEMASIETFHRFLLGPIPSISATEALL